MDYTGMYEDILDIEHRAATAYADTQNVRFWELTQECFAFRAHIIFQCRTLVAWAA
jgi:hypothetical protein